MALPDERKDSFESIEEHYAGKSVLITGGTGFLGKVFLEKLLYSCPKIDQIFLLIRVKNKLDASERINKLLELPVFHRIKKERPENLKKVVPVSGDISLPNLGIHEEDEQILIEKVSHVFHFAANIKFNEPLKVIINANVGGTRRVLSLCRRLKNVEAFVHVSTAYSNTDQPVLEEIIYPSPIAIDEVYRVIEQENLNKEEEKKLLCGRPNGYSLAKAIAENIVKEEHDNVPTIIIRPSIVSASLSEPMMGWVDNMFGATAIITTVGKGLNRILISKGSNILDLIPVDYVSNLAIVAAAKCNRSKEVLVYNSCTSAVNPLTMVNISRLTIEDSIKHKCSEILRPTVILTESECLLKCFNLITTIFAFIADCLLRLARKPPRFMKMHRWITLVRESLRFFTSNSWVMKCQRTRDLFASLPVSERHRFPFDPVHIEWDKYISIYCMGIRKYLLK